MKHPQKKRSSNSLLHFCSFTQRDLSRLYQSRLPPITWCIWRGECEGRRLGDCRGWCDGRKSNSAVLQELGEICGWETKSEQERERERKGVRGQERWCVVAKQRLITKSPGIMLVVPCLRSRPESLSLCRAYIHVYIFTLIIKMNGNKRTDTFGIWKRAPEKGLSCFI